MTIPVPSLKLMLVFLGALILCMGLTWLLLRKRGELGLDKPDLHRKKHGHSISRLGGLPLFITLMAGMCVMAVNLKNQERSWWPVLICNAIVFSIGFFDDLKPLGARVKLLSQIGAACIFYGLVSSIEVITHPLTHEPIPLGWWSPVITILWLISIPNIINLIDGMDGLATGFGLFLCLTLAFVGHFSAMPDVVMISTVMAGALAGFLVFNFPPAKIFLGDGGAYLIGFFVASVSLTTSRKGYVLGAMLVIVVALGIPILDTLFAIMRRAIRGLPLFRADAEHIHHRLIGLGYSKGQALAVLYATGAILSLIGMVLLTQRGHGTVITAAALAIAALAAARYLGYVKSFRGLRQQISRAMQRRRELEYARAYGRVLELEADKVSSAVEFVELLTRTLHRLGFTLRPDQGRALGGITLLDQRLWWVGRNDLELPDEVWRARLEALQAGLQRALTHWRELPGVTLKSATEHPKPPSKGPLAITSDPTH
jgi:UDP-GlcNAc:undecaprenyl-phosphate GlcNAc-1-phosphate transferase